MTRNQKIALGCGGAGCLGLIAVAVACVVAYTFFYQRRPAEFTVNANRSSNINSSDSSADDAAPSDDPSSSDESSTSTMSGDDKHKLFHAASMTQDTAVIQRVWRKLGFMRANGSMTNEYEQFARDHFAWTMRNRAFIQSLDTPDKARAYVDAHIDD